MSKKQMLLIFTTAILLCCNFQTNKPAHAFIDTVTIDSTWAISDTIFTLYRYHIQVFTVNLTDTTWDTTHVITGFLQFGDEFTNPVLRAAITNSSGFDSLGYSMISLSGGVDTMYAVYIREGRANRKYWVGGAIW